MHTRLVCSCDVRDIMVVYALTLEHGFTTLWFRVMGFFSSFLFTK
jgi:hypothetical protein